MVGGELGLQVELCHARVAHHVQERVDHVAPRPAALDDLQALRLEALLVVVAGARREAAGVDGADVGDMDEVGDEAGQPPVEVDRGDQVDVGRMQRRGVGVVEEVDVVLVDPGVVPVGRDHVLHRLGGARQVMQEADAADHERAVGPVERSHQIVPLVRDRGAGDVLERDDRLLHHRQEPVADDLERERVDGGARSQRSPSATLVNMPGASRPPVPATSASASSATISASTA